MHGAEVDLQDGNGLQRLRGSGFILQTFAKRWMPLEDEVRNLIPWGAAAGDGAVANQSAPPGVPLDSDVAAVIDHAVETLMDVD